MRVIGVVILSAILAAQMPFGALASDAERWPFASSPMLNLQPLPEEAFLDPVAFCRGVLFVMQTQGKTKGAAIAIMAV